MTKDYDEYGFITSKKKEMAVKQWPLYRQKVFN